ncbi:methylenetetrahydrofolate reductase [Ancylobacter mangrovi]|uniref:methylenetetrahydrofolate reductase n=1 Tax=Ancylobacter mangrovi TaxID=2972472 RepID=UPI0021634FB2|nr:methylenetetrahydrofolate reductase [Ancylobacter mangrovi]MCS0502904.1 methylenetetrahydrofolate reductase [Ancylobacter mangrovi]
MQFSSAERDRAHADETVGRPDHALALAALAQRFSIEVSPKEALRGAAELDVPAGTRTFVTRLPKGSFEETLAAASALKRAGLDPVPHVTARTIPDAPTLEAWLTRFVREAGVREILLIAGSNEQPAGAFAETADVLRTGIVEASGLQAVNFAGHPEGHPSADAAELQRALDLKNEFAARTGLPCALVTQFFFDAAPVIAWEKRLRQQGNSLPVDPGLHGVTGVPSLLKHALACGIGASIKALSSHSGGMLQFAQIRTPDALARAIAEARASDPDSLFRGFHLFPLGGLARTVSWIRQLRGDAG